MRVGDVLLGIEFGGGEDCGDTSQPLLGMRLARRGRVLPYKESGGRRRADLGFWYRT